MNLTKIVNTLIQTTYRNEEIKTKIERTIAIRAVFPSEYPRLEEFLFLALHQPKGKPAMSKDILKTPEIKMYIEDFGTKDGDYALFAIVENKIVGAVWSRILVKPKGYGNVDAATPELAISVLPQYRNCGVGSSLIQGIFRRLKENGYKKVTLSVDKTNPAMGFYKREGFAVFKKQPKDFIMLYIL